MIPHNEMPGQMTCPTCARSFLREHTTTPPFCSTRCQQIDLRRWLNEDYRLPCESNDHPEHDLDEEDLEAI